MNFIYFACMLGLAVIAYSAVSAYVQTRRTRIELELEIKQRQAKHDVAVRATNMNRSALQYIDMAKRGQITFDRATKQAYIAKGYTQGFEAICVEKRPFVDVCESLQAVFRSNAPEPLEVARAVGMREFCRDWLFSLKGSKGLEEFHEMFGEV